MKITTTNFQILEGKNEFEFKEGINVIVGPNASGKSSLFYALENCLYNPNGVNDCINYNATKTTVNVQDNNESVTWERTADTSSYINEKTQQKYLKASKLDSRDIADLGFYFDTKGRVLNIHDEWSVLFPFGESDTDMFRLFEDIFNLSCSFQIIDEMKKDEQEVKANITNNQNKKAEISTKIDTCNNILKLISVNDIDKTTDHIKSAEDYTSKLREDYQYYQSKSSLLKQIILPEMFDVSILYEQKNIKEKIEEDYNTYLQYLNKVNIIVPKYDTTLVDNISSTEEISLDYEKYCVNQASLNDLQEQLKDVNDKISEKESIINNIRVCPTCGRTLDE